MSPPAQVLPSVPPEPEPYHGAGEVVLGQTEIHHTLGTVEVLRGWLWQGLWHEVGGGQQKERSQSALPPVGGEGR